MSSIVADELAKIKSFETDTEKRRSELTLNELNYISDKQLHRKVDEEGGGSGDSLVKAADVRFTTDDTMYSGDLSNVFPNGEPIAYFPEDGEEPAFVALDDFDNFPIIADWNANMDDGMRLVTPQGFLVHDDSFNVSVVSGSAEIMETGGGSVLYITGDCTIQISVKGESD